MVSRVRITPRFCPRPSCPSRARPGFPYRRRGHFRRSCDRRLVQRFLCLACRRSFSTQTFRLDYRLKRPELLVPHFWLSVSKVTHRQSARMLDCARTTEERHFQRLSAHCKAFHEAKLRAIEARGGLGRSFLFDELQTFEAQRTRKPVTVPVLIERRGFVLDARTGSLAIQKR